MATSATPEEEMSDDPNGGPWVLSSRKNARQIEKINSCLQDTNRNLLALNQQLIQSKELSKEKAAHNEMLMEDIALRSKQLREERQKLYRQKIGLANKELDMESPTSRPRHRMATHFEGRGVESDMEFSQHSQPDISVRFFDDMDAGRHLHSLHQSMRDLGSEQRQIRNEIRLLKNASSSMDAINPGIAKIPTSLQIKKEVEEAVAKRLEAIRNVRSEERLRSNPSEFGISAEFKEALNRLNQGEDLKLSTTLNVMKDHQKQMSRMSEDNASLKLLVAQLQQQIKDLIGNDSVQEQRRKEKDELRNLRSEPSRYAAAASESAILKQELEQSERQRVQLSEHIEALNRALENKERNDRRMFQDSVEETARLHSLSTQKDLESRLNDSNCLLQSANVEKSGLQVELQMAVKKNEDLKMQAQQTVKLWKQKNQKLEKFKDLYEESRSQNEKLSRELLQLKSRDGVAVESFDRLKRDVGELMRSNAQLAEEVHMKDVQLNELVIAKMDLTKDLMDSKSVIERLENELHVVNEKMRMVNQSRNLLEDQLNSVQSSKLKTGGVIHQLQRDLNDVIVSRKELISQISQLKSDKKELTLNIIDLKQMYTTARNEIVSLEQQSKEELKEMTLKLETAQKEVFRLQERDSNKVKELTVKLKKEEAEYTAEIQASKVEIDELKMRVRQQKKQINAFEEEVKRLIESLTVNEETTEAMQLNLSKIRQQLLSNSFITEDGLSQSKDLEMQLLDSKEEIVQLKKNHQNILHKVAEEIEDFICRALGEGTEKFKILTKTVLDADYFLADLKDKLEQIEERLAKRRSKENKVKANLRDAIIHGERDRQILTAEYEKQANQLGHVVPVKNENLSKSVKSGRLSPSKFSALEDKYQENFDQEREEIRRRYEKQQETLNFLKQELINLQLHPIREKGVGSDVPTRDLDWCQGAEDLHRSSITLKDG